MKPRSLTRPSATLSPVLADGHHGERKKRTWERVPGAALRLPRATIFSPSVALSLARFARTAWSH
jgi:hypothetical protein